MNMFRIGVRLLDSTQKCEEPHNGLIDEASCLMDIYMHNNFLSPVVYCNVWQEQQKTDKNRCLHMNHNLHEEHGELTTKFRFIYMTQNGAFSGLKIFTKEWISHHWTQWIFRPRRKNIWRIMEEEYEEEVIPFFPPLISFGFQFLHVFQWKKKTRVTGEYANGWNNRVHATTMHNQWIQPFWGFFAKA